MVQLTAQLGYERPIILPHLLISRIKLFRFSLLVLRQVSIMAHDLGICSRRFPYTKHLLLCKTK